MSSGMRSKVWLKRHLAGFGVMLAVLFAMIQLVGLVAINKLMFHPEMVKGGYDETLPGSRK